jgi:membrane-bound lytic murein transglycosylase D
MHAIQKLVIAAIIALTAWSPAWAELPSLNEAAAIPQGLTLCNEPVPSENQDVRERYEKEMLLTLWDRPQVILWLKRCPRYLLYIADQLRARNLPDDLKYVAVAESALRPHAGSSKGAVGFWQMLSQTGRTYGLEIDEFIDGRREIKASTGAALNYLEALYKKFGSWTLAVAAYNMGEEGLEAEIIEQETNDYYRLYLPLETQRFIFRILAIKQIYNDPLRYGFQIPAEDTYPALRYEEVSVDCLQETPIRIVAEAAGTYFKMIKDLNPHLRGHYLQAGHHRINLPEGSGKGFETRFAQLVSQYNELRQQRIYIVQPGDSLSSIAERFNVPLAALLIWNRVDTKRPIHPGDRLVVQAGLPQQPDSTIEP